LVTVRVKVTSLPMAKAEVEAVIVTERPATVEDGSYA
jgi:hypothetical protein